MAYIGNSPANVGNYQIIDDVSSSFDGSETSFALASGGIAITPAKSGQLLVGVNGVMQQPDDTGTKGFKVSSSNIVFSSAPASADTFWSVYQGQEVDIGVPSDDVVDTIHIKDGAITGAKIAAGTVVASDIASNSITNVKMADDAVGVAELSASGTASSTTFLRGDNSWVTPTDTTYSIQDGELSAISFTSADNTKLDGIETSAKDDQTAGEILTLLEDGIDSVHYKNGSIDNEHLADDAVDSDEIAAGAIDTAHIGSLQVTTAKIAADAITYAKMQNVVADERILGRVSGANGVVEELTKAQTLTMLNVEDGATGDQTAAEIKTAYESNSDTNEYSDAEQTKVSNLSGTNTGDQTITLTGDVTGAGTGSFAATIATDAVDIAMLSATGTAGNTTFLRGDNSWVVPTDTNTTYTAGTGITLSGGEFSASPLALTTVQTAANQSAQLALTTQEGDVVVRSDENKSYVHNGGTAGTMGDFTLLATPTDAVLSVNSVTGAITAAHIKTAYEANSDTNEFSDAEQSKLSGIAASANAYVHPNHSGDVVSAADGAMTIQTDAVDIAMLSATGTAGATTFLRGDNTWVVPTDTNTTYSVQDGELSQINFTSADHSKLNGIASSANNYSHPTSAGNKHIPSGGSSGQFLKYTSAGTAVWAADNNTTYSVGDGGLTQVNFTTADNSKLDGIASSANNYSHPTSAGSKHIPTGGSSGQFLKYSSSGTAVWAADNNTTYSVGDGGLTQVNFTTADNSKLDGIASSANNYSHPTNYAGDDFSIDTGALSGATVVSDVDINVTTDTSGHVTDANGSISTRTLTLANLGYTGSTSANNYSHPSYNGDDFSVDTGALTGATVVSDVDINVTTDSSGHVTDANGSVSTRTLTLANLGYTGATNANNYSLPSSVIHESELSSSTSSTSTTTAANLAGVKSAYDKGNHSHPYAASSHTHSYLPTAGGTMTGALDFGDNVKANFGASDDLRIYHDGYNSYIDDAGTGSLRLRGSQVLLEKYTGETILQGVADGGVYIYHNNSSKLATTATGIDVTGTVSDQDGNVRSGRKNLIINGAMQMAQRGTSDTVNGGGWDYVIDRFCALGTSTGVFIYSQDSEAPAGFNKSLKVAVTTADASLAAGDIYCIRHTIEGFNSAHLNYGSSDAKTTTLSFWVRSSLTGTFGGALNSEGNRSYPFTYSISSANTWEKKSITISGDTTGTWGTGNSHGVRITWGLGVGSTYSGTTSSWAGSEYFSVTSSTSVIGTNSSTWYITGVQLELGTAATDFEHRSYGEELALCQRYYSRLDSSGTGYNAVASGVVRGSTACSVNVDYPATMRTTPSFAMSGSWIAEPSGGGQAITTGTPYLANSSMLWQPHGLSGATTGTGVIVHANADANAYLAWDAEL